jgi:hypothetical protein
MHDENSKISFNLLTTKLKDHLHLESTSDRGDELLPLAKLLNGAILETVLGSVIPH